MRPEAAVGGQLQPLKRIQRLQQCEDSHEEPKPAVKVRKMRTMLLALESQLAKLLIASEGKNRVFIGMPGYHVEGAFTN